MKWVWKGLLTLAVVLALVLGGGLGYRGWRQHEGEAYVGTVRPLATSLPEIE
jgi:hypothetical protein